MFWMTPSCCCGSLCNLYSTFFSLNNVSAWPGLQSSRSFLTEPSSLSLSYLSLRCCFICRSSASLWRTCRMSTGCWGPKASPCGACWEASSGRYAFFFFLPPPHLPWPFHSAPIRHITPSVHLYSSDTKQYLLLFTTSSGRCRDMIGVKGQRS